MSILFILMGLFFLNNDNPKQIRDKATLIYKQALNAQKEGKNEQSIKLFQHFLTLRPNYIYAYFNLAKLYAANRQYNKAFDYLNRIAEMKFKLNPANFEDPDFKQIPLNELNRLKASFSKNAMVKGTVDTYFQLAEKDLISESVAIDQTTGNQYISSVRKRKIIKRFKNGKVIDFSKQDDGIWAAFSLKISPDNNSLWLSSSATKEMQGYKEDVKYKTGLFQYDLESGKLNNKYILPDDQKEHIWGDFIFSKTGQIYVSDSKENTIYMFDPSTNGYEKLIESNYFSSLQGLAFNTDETQLLVADYSEGIYKFDLKTKLVTQVIAADHISVRGLDGIYWKNNSLVATQNGFNPNRVIQLQLNKSLSKITDYKILIANHKLIDDPTLGQLIDDEFYFIGNSQWNMIKRDGTIKKLSELKKPSILKVKIK